MNGLQGFSNAQAREVAAVPPPPPPLIATKGQLSRPQVYSPHPDTQHFANEPPDFGNTQADFWEVEDFTATNPFLSEPMPESDFPFTSGEEIAGIPTKSDQAMAEIYRICEPFLDPGSDLHGPAPMDLSAELMHEMGLDIMFQTQKGVQARRKGNGNARPDPAQTMPARDVAQQKTPIIPNKQGTKRKECEDGNGNFQHVQLDVEKQERRPRKQVKSVHHANFQNNNGALYHDAAFNTQQQQHFDPQCGYYQSEFPQEQALGGPALQGGKYASVDDADQYTGGGRFEEQTKGMIGQHFNQNIEPSHHYIYPATPFMETFPDRQPSVDSPYQTVPTPRAQSSNSQTLNIQPHGLEEYFSQGSMEPGQTLTRPPPMSSPMPNAQPPGRQIPANRPRSRADREHDREPLGQTNNKYRYHPYANSRKGNGQRMEAPQAHQINNENQLQPTETPVAQGGEDYHLEMTPGPLEHFPLQSTLPDAPLDPNVEGVFIYKNSDPAQGLDVEATRKTRDWLSQR